MTNEHLEILETVLEDSKYKCDRFKLNQEDVEDIFQETRLSV